MVQSHPDAAGPCTSCGAVVEAGARYCGVCGFSQYRRAPVPPAGLVSPDHDPYQGMVLNNRFQVLDKLGEGGFGAVYRGKQLATGREVAIKLLHPETTRDGNVLARFRREGQVLCALRDAHTVTTYDFDQTPDGTLYIAMELLGGRSLHDVFYEEAPIDPRRMLRILAQMCSSLLEAHQNGIVHRDLKPENVYLEPRPGDPEFVKILDFGVAKLIRGEGAGAVLSGGVQLTATGQTLGTLEYMSPEQLMGKPLDGRSDIYTLGVLCYELLAGRLPFPDATEAPALVAAQLRRKPEPPSVANPSGAIPPEVDQLVLKMLEKDRELRPKDMLEIQLVCHQVLAGVSAVADPKPVVPVHTEPKTEPVRVRARVSRPMPPGSDTLFALRAVTGSRRWLWVAGLLAVAALVAGIVLALG